jgi:uncharacterized protein YndB with AHSA1/START domain
MSNEERFSISVDINTPVDRVFEVMSDTERWHEWTPSVRSIKLLDADGFRIGTRALVRQPKFPPALWKITAIDRTSFTWETRSPGIRVIAQHSAEPTATGARATLSLRYQGLFARLLARMTRGITNRYLAMEASGLKARAENPFFTHSTA